MYDDQLAHARLMRVLERQRGHELSARAEAAKIAGTEKSAAEILLDFIDVGLGLPLSDKQQTLALKEDVERIVEAARETVSWLRSRAFPAAETVRGDRYASVVSGLAITGSRRFVG